MNKEYFENKWEQSDKTNAKVEIMKLKKELRNCLNSKKNKVLVDSVSVAL